MTSFRTASVLISSSLFVATALAIFPTANAAIADDTTSVTEYFFAKNPKEAYPQFQSTNVHLIYSCIYARGVEPTSVCEDLSAIAARNGLVTYLRSRFEDQIGVNFLISGSKRPANSFKHVYGACGFRDRINRSIVIIEKRIRPDDLERCFYTSSLVHLGFYVDTTISAKIDRQSFDEIVAHYVGSNAPP
ncbi:hypothetical protein HNR26_002979 [Rhizobium rosettiformans]|uniref:Uncharacterized protein n=2 Tax=Rhizobium rosettiformans TaxID=1368430 RepID=A0A4S8PTI3_9HYPH|nr:hypothetical protein [Rhizobium rosettiformans]MBB5276901.1 hypothetical protein [Rhizobium rosettiformans]THV34717.1 hypothetical protein FAA86_13600 [Rhizobium rosettiformans W3]